MSSSPQDSRTSNAQQRQAVSLSYLVADCVQHQNVSHLSFLRFSWKFWLSFLFLLVIHPRIAIAQSVSISGNVFEDTSGNDTFENGEPLLPSVAVSIYLDDGDRRYETNGQDTLVETKDTDANGNYTFANLTENQDYWVRVDTTDTDLSSYSYGGGDVATNQVNPRQVSLAAANISGINFPFDTLPRASVTNNVCYTVADGTSSPESRDRDLLIRLNRLTGVEEGIGTGTNTSLIEAIAFDPISNTLYAGNGSQFGTINLSTGAFTRIGNTNFTDIDGLAINPFTGELFASIRNNGALDQLIKIDPTTGTKVTDGFNPGIDTLNIAAIGGFSDIDDITVNPLTGQIFGVANNGGGGNLLVKIIPDPANSIATTASVGTFGVGDMEGFSSFLDGTSFYGTTGNVGTDRNNFYLIDSNTGAAALQHSLGINFGGGVSRDYESVDCATAGFNTLRGAVFADLDSDGDFNNSDTETEGATVRLYRDRNGDGILNDSDDVTDDGILNDDDILATQETDSIGDYSFQFNAAGTFIVTLDANDSDLPTGITFTTNGGQNLATANFGNTAGQTINDKNFGYAALDYGDAIIDYDDTADNNNLIDANDDPARHIISSNLNLGTAFADPDNEPQSSTNADEDDTDGTDDEDGISTPFPPININSTSYSLTATVKNSSGSAANVFAWIDFDRDGEFDEDERATVDDGSIVLDGNGKVPSGNDGTVTLRWNDLGGNGSGGSGANLTAGTSYMRARLTTDYLDQTTETTGRDDAAIDEANDGEIEDYQLTIDSASTPPSGSDQSYCESIGGTLNTSNLYVEVNSGTFGVGNAKNEESSLPSGSTTYTYDADYPPQDGEYVVSTLRDSANPGFGTWHNLAGHTTGSDTDKFLVINVNDQIIDTEMIQSSVITGLTPNTNYTFTAYILNLIKAGTPNHIDPNVSYGIDLIGVDDDDDGTIDEAQEIEVRFNSGEIAKSASPTWIQYAFLFNTGTATEARFILRNNNVGGTGNDLAIDDISLRGCNLPSGNLQGTLYYDNNGNDNFDSGEPGLPAGASVRLIDTKGTSITDDDVIISRLANPGGEYNFLNIPVGNNYQILAPDDDGAAGTVSVIGTMNPLSNVSVTAGTTTSNQDFGYDANTSLLLVKRITAINPGQPDEVVFNNFVDDPDDDNDDALNWPNKNTYLRGRLNAADIEPGNEIEYTIYFLSNGSQAVNKMSLCDVIPDNMTFVDGSYSTDIGIGLGLDNSELPSTPNLLLSNLASDTDQGKFFLPDTTPPAFCQKVDSSNNLVTVTNANNTNGAVVIDLGTDTLPPATAPGNPTNSYGFVRFRARVK